MQVSEQTASHSGSVNGSLHQQPSPRCVWMGFVLLDTLQNLVANTRTPEGLLRACELPPSALRRGGQFSGGGSQPAAW